jgi:hypothetical protein
MGGRSYLRRGVGVWDQWMHLDCPTISENTAQSHAEMAIFGSRPFLVSHSIRAPNYIQIEPGTLAPARNRNRGRLIRRLL